MCCCKPSVVNLLKLIVILGHQNLLMKIILLLLFCCTAELSFAAAFIIPPPEDSTLERKAYELNWKEFLEKYGRDDSSRALINLFFHKREIGVPNAGIGAPMLLAGGIGLGITSNKLENGTGSWNTLGQALLFTLILGAGAALFSVGMSFLGKYSRKKLLKLLDGYFAGKPLPRGITKNRAFRKNLQSAN